MSKITKLITNFFGVGLLPFVPGTFGSLAGLLIYFFVKDNTVVYGVTSVLLFTAGCIFSGRAERLYRELDAKVIVIDEVCGMLITLFLVPYSIIMVIAGFIIFRLLDIVKIPPARLVEKRGGSLGIMADDLISAVYTNILLHVIHFLFLA